MKFCNIKALLTGLLIFAVIITAGCGGEEKQIGPKATKDQPAPDFTLTDLKGNQWKLSELRGKVVFINFWATWCPPCIKEMPSMQALQEKMAGRDFQMLAIMYNDRPEMGQSFLNMHGYTFPALIDPDSWVAQQYGLTGVPETFIIDPEGILREKYIGPYDWNSSDALQAIEPYLPK